MSSIYNSLFERLVGSILKTDKIFPFLGKDLVVGVSGGVDSYVLYYVIKKLYEYKKYKSKVVPVHIKISGDKKVESFSDSVVNLDVKEDIDFPITCYECSRIRRKYIFEYCNNNGIKFVLFAHHRDDFAERFLWNIFYYKKLESLPLVRSYFEGKIFVIRPFKFVKKSDIERFAKISGIEDKEYKCSVKNKVNGLPEKISECLGMNYVDIVNNINYIIEQNSIYGELDE